ncbi:dead end protein 1 isoform X1 [Takifugu rubripes]|uniref:RRM domain-containing protein n=1 Tax=Takifugu rubripes TaxID=31033 RepID=H2TE01_TAKRU|nr:dead end protein homolog 1 isoform X1 [Takifugu rubripes]
MMDESQSQILNLDRVKAFHEWLERTNTKITQVNGQRKYGGPPDKWDGPVPGARCEIYITHIPRDTYEDVLIPLFTTVGPLWQFRLMMNFSGQNRGFAYAKYGSPAIAASAIQLLHGHMIEPGVSLCVRHSTEKRQLCIGGLPVSTKQADISQVMHTMCEGIERVSLKSEPGIAGMSAVVTFSSHYTASMAKKVVIEAFKNQYALRVSVSWFSSFKASPNLLLPPQNLVNVSCRSSVLLPRQTGTLFHSPSFCKAVGGPITPRPYECSTPSSRASLPSPMMLLNNLCQTAGFGPPHYKISCSRAGPDGYLHFSYQVFILGINMSLEGVIMILPGANISSTMEEAREAVAQQVLRKVFHRQVSH